ncbi:hypothetical protein V6N13_143593 [Hibiscus sabdariffa]
MKNAVWTWLQRVPLVAAMRGHAKALKGSKGKGSPAFALQDRTKDIEDVVRVFVFKHRTVELEHCGRAHRGFNMSFWFDSSTVGDPVGKFQAVCKTHTAIPFNNRIVAIGQSLAEILVQGRMESRLRAMDWQRATNYQWPCAHEFNVWDHFDPEEDPTAAP